MSRKRILYISLLIGGRASLYARDPSPPRTTRQTDHVEWRPDLVVYGHAADYAVTKACTER